MSFYETHELHRKEALRTRWYQCTYQEMKKAIFDIAEELGYGVTDVNDTYQEILLEGPNVLVIKVSSFSRYEQGVDFNLSTKWFFDFGLGKNTIIRLYDQLAKHVKFKGVSLHP